MRVHVVIPVLLGLVPLASSARADWWGRDHTRTPYRVDRLHHGLERARPGDAGMGASAHREAMHAGSHHSDRGQQLLGRAAPNSRMTCNEANECSMSASGAQANIRAVASSRGPGINPFANNAKGKQLLGKAAPMSRMACNEADECSMNTSGAKVAVLKAATSRRAGVGFANNAKGKQLLSKATPMSRTACNEAEECSMNNSGVAAAWFKAGVATRGIVKQIRATQRAQQEKQQKEARAAARNDGASRSDHSPK
jgi:hypothetical protein